MAYLDLEESPQLLRRSRVLSSARFAAASFRPSDHLRGELTEDSADGLAEAVRRRVEVASGVRPTGRIAVLTQLRQFGGYFSPINLFYCFDTTDRVAAVLAEVSNTPWNERRYYVLHDGNRVASAGAMRFAHKKDFHVSPFRNMAQRYQWRLSAPEERLAVHLRSLGDGRPFDASMALRRRPLTDGRLARTLLLRPFMTTQIMIAIYWQAFRLWRKKCPYYPHPATHAAPASLTAAPSAPRRPRSAKASSSG